MKILVTLGILPGAIALARPATIKEEESEAERSKSEATHRCEIWHRIQP